MLRNILVKLTNLTDVPVSPCDVRMLRSLSPTAHKCRRDTKKITSKEWPKYSHRRSYSFPATKQKSSQVSDKYKKWTDKSLQDSKGNESSVSRDSRRRVNTATTIQRGYQKIEKTKKQQESKAAGVDSEFVPDEKKYYENCDVTEQYELEGSKPRKSQSELVFNVFEYMDKLEKDVDPTNYLQPNNLRPFGSMDNVYYSLMMRSRESNLLRFPQSSGTADTELCTSVRKVKTKDNVQQRDYSTNTRTFHGPRKAPTDLIEQLPPFGDSANYASMEPKLKQVAKKSEHGSGPKRDKKVEEASGVAKEYKQKLIRSKQDSGESGKDVYETFNIPWCENKTLLETSEKLQKQEPFATPVKQKLKLQTPWLSYSDALRISKTEIAEEAAEHSALKVTSTPELVDHKPMAVQKRPLSTEAPQPVDMKHKSNNDAMLRKQNKAGAFQKRMLATGTSSNINLIKTVKSNLHVSVESALSPMQKKLLMSEKTYVKTGNFAKSTRPLDPKTHEKASEAKKCFLPSKVRLKPPICTPKPPPCPVEEPCVRSDDCLEIKPKKLPIIRPSDCPCVEEIPPEINPRMKRLCFKFSDPPRVCPEVPSCSQRADDKLVSKPKKLSAFKPRDCDCVEPPAMTDVKFRRLQKTCIPEAKCYPKPECPQPEPCMRADDSLVVCEKPLPQLKTGLCPCVETEVPNRSPHMRRLKFRFEDPPRQKSCQPINPCPPRADDHMPEKLKQLPRFKPADCACIELPPMVDVPLKRLQKTCIPEQKCYPKEECPVPEPCIRADDCWEPKVKPLSVIKDGPCLCIEPFVPDKAPKLKRLDLECLEQPRPLTCQPRDPCPPRADATWKPKTKKLPHISMGDCECVDASPMVDVPLRRLQKVCEPEVKCYPKEECPKPEPCRRADDGSCDDVKPLPVLEAKDCPCVEIPPMKQAPALKRLDLRICEPPRVCPQPTCEERPRADDDRKDMAKNLPKLRAGDCPCVEQPIVEAPPLKRLVCEDGPEECMETDPCSDTPRADMGCWEYYRAEEQKCGDNAKDKSDLSFNSKRRYNTDSRVTLFDEIRNARKPRIVGDSEKNSKAKKAIVKDVRLSSSRSVPTMQLIKELRILEEEATNRLSFRVSKKDRMNLAQQDRDNICGNAVRKLSTAVANMSGKKKEMNKAKPTCHKVGSPCKLNKLQCVSEKCPLDCHKGRTPVCCDKKTSPYPAYSELAEEEVEPFSDTTKFTCGHKEYGFNPRYKRPYGPFSDGNKKKYCQMATREETRLDINGKLEVLENKQTDGISNDALSPTTRGNILCDSIRRNNSSSSRKDKKCKPKKCPKFEMDSCPQAVARPKNCHRTRPVYVCVKEKLRAPYPAFTDCLDEELAENLSECPLEVHKIRRLQPGCMDPLDRPRLTKPVEPIVGKVDPLIEQECVKTKLAIENRGLSQSCHDFGKFQRVMRAKDHLKEVNRDCVEIERLRKLGKWPPKNSRGLCSISHNLFRIHKRGMCKFSKKLKENYFRDTENVVEEGHDLRRKEAVRSLGFNACPKSIYIRKYHVLCNKPDKKIHEVSQYREDDSCKFTKLRNVQWRIDNFQKWHRLEKLNNFDDSAEFHSNTLSSTKKFRYLGQKTFSTSATKLVPSPESLEASVHRNISTTYFLTRSHNNERSVSSMKGKYPKGSKSCIKFTVPNSSRKKRNATTPYKKLSSPYPSFSECNYDASPKIYECPIRKERMQQLQPQYPILPEVSSGSLHEVSEQVKMDPTIGEEYVRNKYGLEKEGLTEDCNSFGTKRKPLTCKIAKEQYEMMTRHEEAADGLECPAELVGIREPPNCSAHTEWCRIDKIHGNPPRRTLADDCTKPKLVVSNADACDSKDEKGHVTSNECEGTARGKSMKECPKINNPCLCKSKVRCQAKELSIWEKVVNYFRARPNCPAPGDWKKKQAKEKAEKYAKAAGLIVCDPKDLPKACGKEELPKVITSKCPKIPNGCDSKRGKRSFSTICIIPRGGISNDRKTASLLSMSHRWYSSGPVGDEDIASLDGEENLTHKEENITEIDRRYFSTMINTETKDVDSEPAVECYENFEVDKNNVLDFDVELRDEDGFNDDEIKDFEMNCASDARSTVDTNDHGVNANQVSEDDSRGNELCNKKSASAGGGAGSSISKCSTGYDDATGRRHYSSHVNWHNLEDINKSLEEEEKKQLMKKIMKPFIEDASNSEEHDFEDESDEKVQRKLDQTQEDISGRNPYEVGDQSASFSNQIGQRKLSFFDMIFHEPIEDTTGYNQARAFAAFQEFFHKVEVFSDANYEEMEINKTNNMVQELNKLMDENQAKKK